MTDESPDARRARRLAEAKALRGTPERAAQVEALLQAKAAEEAAAEASRPSRAPSTRSSPRSPRSPRASRSTTPVEPKQPGHTLPVWMQMRGAALAHLEACAKANGFTDADAVWEVVKASRPEPLGDQRYQLPKLIAYVDTKSLEDTGFLASALIVQPASGEPAADFFRAAVKRGRLEPSQNPPSVDASWDMTAGQLEFWTAQVEGFQAHYS